MKCLKWQKFIMWGLQLYSDYGTNQSFFWVSKNINDSLLG